jgi:hypothetical protein
MYSNHNSFCQIIWTLSQEEPKTVLSVFITFETVPTCWDSLFCKNFIAEAYLRWHWISNRILTIRVWGKLVCSKAYINLSLLLVRFIINSNPGGYLKMHWVAAISLYHLQEWSWSSPQPPRIAIRNKQTTGPDNMAGGWIFGCLNKRILLKSEANLII